MCIVKSGNLCLYLSTKRSHCVIVWKQSEENFVFMSATVFWPLLSSGLPSFSLIPSKGLARLLSLHVIWPLSFIILNYSSLTQVKIWNSTSRCFRSRMRDRNNFLKFKGDCVRSEKREIGGSGKKPALHCFVS